MISSLLETARGRLHDEARRIFSEALRESSIPAAFDTHLHFEDTSLILPSRSERDPVRVSLEAFDEIYGIALGKAALPMLASLRDRMPGSLRLSGICCAPSLPAHRHSGIRYFTGGHPFPNKDSFLSARAALRLLRHAGKNSFVFFLISGGGSAMFELPLARGISLEDTIEFHRALVGSGASIAEINAVRKHFSAVKGGRLAIAAAEAYKLSLLVSDVPATHLDALSSGPTLPDSSSVEDCRDVLKRYQLFDRFPSSVRDFFMRRNLPETPGEKRFGGRLAATDRATDQRSEELASLQGSHMMGTKMDTKTGANSSVSAGSCPSGFGRSQVETVLSNQELVAAAQKHAEKEHWKVVIDNTCDDWDYREAARYLLMRLQHLRREHPRLCLLSGGEVTVHLDDKNPGAGGRNQQFALACALELAGHPLSHPSRGENPIALDPGASIVVLSAGSDGVDGNSPAAGAISDATTFARAQTLGFDPEAAIRNFDSFPLFAALGDTIVTGPTNNNLRDLRILLSC